MSNKIADKYISESGRTRNYGPSSKIDDLICAASFLVWAEDQYFGGEKGSDAFRAMCRLVDVNPRKLRKVVRCEE